MAVTSEKQLVGAKITSGPQPWQVIQRGADGYASVTLEGTWHAEQPGKAQVRVASVYDGASVPGCDWTDAEMLENAAWRATLRIPTGGLYRIESRGWLSSLGGYSIAGDHIWHIAVGDLWVIAGQSNAVGYGRGPVVDPPAFGVSVFGGNEVWRLATHPIFDPTGTKHLPNRDEGCVGVSPWLSFGKEILEHTGVPIGLIPTALGGSPLSLWDPGNPDGACLYENMIDIIEAAGGRVAGMVWYQGCTDTNEEHLATTYLARFKSFIEAFRARYGVGLPIITAQLNRYIDYSVTSQLDHGWQIVREAQRQAAIVIPGVALVPTLDLPLSDAIHNSAVGNVTLGQRFAFVARGMVYGQNIEWQTVDVREAKFVDEERRSICLSFNNACNGIAMLTGQPRDFIVEDANGAIPVTSARPEGTYSVIIELERPTKGTTHCHNMYGCDPACTLRDHVQRPVLAFYNLEVI